jgi:hypothetical protein
MKYISNPKVLLIIPPFTQLNTAYPSTAYIKGFLNTFEIDSYQCDLSLEVILSIFNKQSLVDIFNFIEDNDQELSDRAFRVFTQQRRYIKTIELVITFLQNKNQTLANHIVQRDFLPEGYRFEQLTEETLSAFGHMGIHDLARHICTLYLEDIGDLLTECIDEHFGFSRYAERISRTATHFDILDSSLKSENTLVVKHLLALLHQKMETYSPDVVCLTTPFPGNVFAALKCGQFIKSNYPNTKIVLGGGYVNTELRSIYDPRIFDYVDFITLDDGEAPLKHLIEYFQGNRTIDKLKRTFCLRQGTVAFINGSIDFDVPQSEVGTPDYSDLLLDKYLSVIEIVNPMHRLWSDGRWNKLTLAHGCYWGKCSFCDVTLDYIKRYEPISAAILCDRIEQIIEQTGQNGFHFVDEAAPPVVMRDLAIEILKRELTVVWWTNIRFEKTFTQDLCRLLRASGCIAVSGGLEVASDRLLSLMKKGVTVTQVAQVCKSFTDANIMVHAYLMYGFPTQSDQETIDSLEMVRQLFENGVLQSGFWHQFAMTAHSPVGLEPAAYNVELIGPVHGGFAENDYFHNDPSGTDHELYSEGLKKSLHNYMNGLGLELSLVDWFDFETPATLVHSAYISEAILADRQKNISSNDHIVWIGGELIAVHKVKKRKGEAFPMSELVFSGSQDMYSMYIPSEMADTWVNIMQEIEDNDCSINYIDLKQFFEQNSNLGFEEFIKSSSFEILRQHGLLFV